MQGPVALSGRSSGLAHFTRTPPATTTTRIISLCSLDNRQLPLQCRRGKSLVLRRATAAQVCVRAESMGMVTEKLGIRVERNPPESRLSELGVRQWSKWGCPPSNFPWTYSAKETCYLLKGKVKVTPEGANEGVEIQAGDLVVFPNGMSCTWDVSETVDKHYKFD